MQAETTYPAIVGRIIVKLRKNKGMDQGQVAKRTGINRSSLSRIENGDSEPSMTQLAKISEVLGYPPTEILLLADQARKRLVAEGVKVHMEVVKPSTGNLLAFLGAAALGALIYAAATADSDSDSEE